MKDSPQLEDKLSLQRVEQCKCFSYRVSLVLWDGMVVKKFMRNSCETT